MTEAALAIEPEVQESAPEVAESNTTFSPSMLSEDLQHEPSLRNFDDVNKLAKSYVHLVKKLGATPDSLIRLPSGGENWDEVYDKLGRPANPDEYEIPYDTNMEKEFASEIHKLGLSKTQGQQVYNFIKNNGELSNQMAKQQFEELQQENINKLKSDWGAEFQRNATKARQAFLQLADAETLQMFEQTGLGNHPEVVKIFHKVGEILEEDGLLNTDIGGTGAGGRAQVESRLAEIMKPDSGFWDGMHPEHNKLVEEALKLREMLV